MHRKFIVAILLLLPLNAAFAQFGGAFSLGRGGIDTENQTSSDSSSKQPEYTLGRYFKSLGHKDTMSIGWAFGGSIALPGTSQIYNRDYWKLPIIYCGIGGMIGGGIYFNNKFKKTENDNDKLYSTLFFAGAAFFYWGQLMDGAVNYKNYRTHLPGRATVYSILLPGLGQIYNGEYWKLPIYYGGLAVAGYMWHYNDMQFHRFQKQYNLATTPDSGFTGKISSENLKYYRDYYRRFRDYSIVATVALYLLQVIDANVFATMSEFDVNQNLTLKVEPAIITPISHDFSTNYTYNNPIGNNAIGVKFNFNF